MYTVYLRRQNILKRYAKKESGRQSRRYHVLGHYDKHVLKQDEQSTINTHWTGDIHVWKVFIFV